MSLRQLSISNLLGTTDEDIIGEFGASSIAKTKKPSIKQEVREVIEIDQQREDDKIKSYRRKLRECISQIKQEQLIRKTDLFFKIDDISLGHPDYVRDECSNYILTELKKYKFDVFKLDQNTIFVSWKYLKSYSDS